MFGWCVKNFARCPGGVPTGVPATCRLIRATPCYVQNFRGSARGYTPTPHGLRPESERCPRPSLVWPLLAPQRPDSRAPMRLPSTSAACVLGAMRGAAGLLGASVWPRRAPPPIASLTRDRTAGLTLGRPRSTRPAQGIVGRLRASGLDEQTRANRLRALRDQCTYTDVREWRSRAAAGLRGGVWT